MNEVHYIHFRKFPVIIFEMQFRIIRLRYYLRSQKPEAEVRTPLTLNLLQKKLIAYNQHLC